MPSKMNLVSGGQLRIETTQPDELLAVVAQRIARLRKKKASLFDPGIFSEPAWDMMLDLFVEEAMGRDVPLTSVAVASRVPLTTALRYLKVMEGQQLVRRFPHSKDGRVSHVRLTEDALVRMRLILSLMT